MRAYAMINATQTGALMADAILYPSLSEDGWVTSPDKTADYLLSCFIVSDYSQTYSYTGNVASLPWILQETQGDMTQTIILTRNTLLTYFSRFFDNVNVDVTEVANILEPSKAQISIYVKFDDKAGNEHVLGKLLRLSKTIVESIVAINNG